MKSIAIILVIASLSACSGMGMGMRDSSGASGASGSGASGTTAPGNPFDDPANIYFGG